MITAANPYLNFNGNAEEAFTFYKSVFGGEFSMIMRFSEMPESETIPDVDKNKIMHMSLPIGKGNILMGSDAICDQSTSFRMGTNFSLSIDTDSRAAADEVYGKLSAGGQANMPMEDTFWGSYFGMCTDKFGIQWMVSYDEAQK